MKIRNDKYLATWRTPGKCGLCGKWCNSRCAAHVQTRSKGRLDIAENLLAVGADPFADCKCHATQGTNVGPHWRRLLEAVAKREGVTTDDLEAIYVVLNALPKTPSDAEVYATIDRFPLTSSAAVERIVRIVAAERER